MNTFLISFSLNNEELQQNILKEIQSFDMWARVLPYTWILKSPETAGEIRTKLSSSINGDGKILVMRITNTSWATYDILKEVTDWMKQNV